MKQINITVSNGEASIKEIPYNPIIGSFGLDEKGVLYIFLNDKWVKAND